MVLVAIVGAGQLGGSIAGDLAYNGHTVRIWDPGMRGKVFNRTYFSIVLYAYVRRPSSPRCHGQEIVGGQGGLEQRRFNGPSRFSRKWLFFRPGSPHIYTTDLLFREACSASESFRTPSRRRWTWSSRRGRKSWRRSRSYSSVISQWINELIIIILLQVWPNLPVRMPSCARQRFASHSTLSFNSLREKR